MKEEWMLLKIFLILASILRLSLAPWNGSFHSYLSHIKVFKIYCMRSGSTSHHQLHSTASTKLSLQSPCALWSFRTERYFQDVFFILLHSRPTSQRPHYLFAAQVPKQSVFHWADTKDNRKPTTCHQGQAMFSDASPSLNWHILCKPHSAATYLVLIPTLVTKGLDA